MAPQKKKQKSGRKNALKRIAASRVIALKDLKFPLSLPWVIVRDAIPEGTKVANLRKKYPGYAWTESIFQRREDTATSVDGLRRYLRVNSGSIRAVTPLLKTLEKVKEPEHIVGGHALIRSLRGCGKQGNHTDYFSMKSHGKVKGAACPYSVVVALEDGSSLYVGDAKVSLPARSAIIFRGDVSHSGSEYALDNIRYHVYIDVNDMHEARKGTHVKWVRGKSSWR
eukprot:CAMPEP_0114435292 /NCGR_PEP_ID=MMETSP0103-20121206/12751_1 /TAXON_ID=37642 ORGANISM="Paraphysomonas imperforata, Strain PA2" /NCGR_SAMPLE_ID=MMETSP0103 /ASSEMBLY_ACC=CAM_ASM_000201 /LENGTH=224 /DNA_ID=CAMNT_0001605305 /DNA_START=17 /DNA_END=688 /DNA_ORIENTATION=+